MTTATRRVTLEEFEALPEGPPYVEFENGEIIELASPTIQHQDIVSELNTALRRYARRRGAGRAFLDVDVYLPDGRVFVPDIGFITTEHIDMVRPIDGKVHGAPDLVVEVTSSDESRDRAHKFHVYHANRVPWLWLVSQSLLIEEYRSTADGYVRISTTEAGDVFTPGLFPGLSIDLAALLGATAGQSEA